MLTIEEKSEESRLPKSPCKHSRALRCFASRSSRPRIVVTVVDLKMDANIPSTLCFCWCHHIYPFGFAISYLSSMRLWAKKQKSLVISPVRNIHFLEQFFWIFALHFLSSTKSKPKGDVAPKIVPNFPPYKQTIYVYTNHYFLEGWREW